MTKHLHMTEFDANKYKDTIRTIYNLLPADPQEAISILAVMKTTLEDVTGIKMAACISLKNEEKNNDRKERTN